MSSLRWRLTFLTLFLVGGVWVIAFAGYKLARNARVTPEKLLHYAQQTDLSRLQGEARSKAIRELARQLNSLGLEDRRKARLEGSVWGVFEQMTEEEKAGFVELTMPAGMKQMLVAFEELPEEKRQRAVDDALKRLRETEGQVSNAGGTDAAGTNGPSLSPELEARIRSIGLKTFYSQSSAQTKAELAPVLEEVQRSMQSGRLLNRRHHR
jgi:hypothetical protein